MISKCSVPKFHASSNSCNIVTSFVLFLIYGSTSSTLTLLIKSNKAKKAFLILSCKAMTFSESICKEHASPNSSALKSDLPYPSTLATWFS